MDPQTFMDIANTVTKLKMWPYFDLSHMILMTLLVREDAPGPQTGSQSFSRKHPLACWFSTMLMVFGGGIIANALLGEPPLAPFKNHAAILMATAVWYLINYSPFDIVYQVVRMLPVRIVVSVLKEVQRAKKIHTGVVVTAKLYPDAYLLMLIIGVVKGAGANIMRSLERVVRGVWIPNVNEALCPTFVTKACIAASVVFILEKLHYINAPHAVVQFGVVIFFVYFRLSSLLFGIHDPFLPFENLFCAIFMGGMWDALRRVKEEVKENGTTKDGKAEAVKSREDKKKD